MNRANGLFQVDAALQKDATINERMGLIFRFDFFNVFNHPPLGSPNLNISSPPTFGRITSLTEYVAYWKPVAAGASNWRCGCGSERRTVRTQFWHG